MKDMTDNRCHQILCAIMLMTIHEHAPTWHHVEESNLSLINTQKSATKIMATSSIMKWQIWSNCTMAVCYSC